MYKYLFIAAAGLLYISPYTVSAMSIDCSHVYGTVSTIEDRSHLQDDVYLTFEVSRPQSSASCGSKTYAITRGNFSEATLKDIKKNLLISYSIKKNLSFYELSGASSGQVEVDLTKSISLHP